MKVSIHGQLQSQQSELEVSEVSLSVEINFTALFKCDLFLDTQAGA